MARLAVVSFLLLLLLPIHLPAQSYRGATSAAALTARAEVEELLRRGMGAVPPAPDAVVISGRYGQILVGLEAFQRANRAVNQSAPRSNEQTEREVVAIEVSASGDLAYVVENFTTTWDKEDGTRTGIRGSSLWALRKVGDSWQGAAFAARDWPDQRINP